MATCWLLLAGCSDTPEVTEPLDVGSRHALAEVLAFGPVDTSSVDIVDIVELEQRLGLAAPVTTGPRQYLQAVRADAPWVRIGR